MPKGYGYDKVPKKTSGFKMKGFSYPGNSPVKGARKRAELQSASDRKYDAMSSIEDFADDMAEGTDLMEAPNTNYGKTPLSKRAPLRDDPSQAVLDARMLEGPSTTNPSFSESFKSAMGSAVGSKAGIAASEALTRGAVNLGITTLASGKEKEPRKRVSSADAFSRVNITGRS